MRGFKVVTALAVTLVGAVGSLAAQRDWGGQVYGGYVTPLSSDLKHYANGGFSWGGGFNYSPEDAIWGIRFDIRNSHFGGDAAAIQKTLDSLGIEEAYNKDGFFRTWDFALAGELGTSKDNKLRAYVLGGVNFSNKYSAITEPTLVGGCWWDPWWGYICSNFFSTYSETLTSYSYAGGVRWDINGALFVRGAYNREWLGADVGDFEFDTLNLDIGLMW